MEPYTGDSWDHLALTRHTSVMIPGEEYDFDAYMFSSQIGVNGPITYSVTNTDGTATDKATVQSYTGVVEALKEGQVKLRITYAGAPYVWVWIVTIEPSMEGTYFFRNGEYGKYMQIDNNADANEDQAIFELWSFDGDENQQWCLEYVEKGYYKIKSAAGGLYATAPNAFNASIVQTAYTGGTHQQWRFTATSDGRYTVSPRMYPNYRLSAGDGILIANGRDVELREEQEDLKDKWILTKIQFVAYVYNYYDHGYNVRYEESAPTSSYRINSYMNEVSQQYLKLFGLEIIAPPAVYYESSVDTCKVVVNSDNIDALCTHDESHTILFNSTNSVQRHFDHNTSPSGSNVITKAYWSGHRIKTYLDTDEYNRCYSSGTSIFMLELSSWLDRDRDSKGILMHELNHQYGARDHYHEILDAGTPLERCRGGDICSFCGVNKRPDTCIMNQSRIDITAETIICSGCKEDIYVHLEDHH